MNNSARAGGSVPPAASPGPAGRWSAGPGASPRQPSGAGWFQRSASCSACRSTTFTGSAAAMPTSRSASEVGSSPVRLGRRWLWRNPRRVSCATRSAARPGAAPAAPAAAASTSKDSSCSAAERIARTAPDALTEIGDSWAGTSGCMRLPSHARPARRRIRGSAIRRQWARTAGSASSWCTRVAMVFIGTCAVGSGTRVIVSVVSSPQDVMPIPANSPNGVARSAMRSR